MNKGKSFSLQLLSLTNFHAYFNYPRRSPRGDNLRNFSHFIISCPGTWPAFGLFLVSDMYVLQFVCYFIRFLFRFSQPQLHLLFLAFLLFFIFFWSFSDIVLSASFVSRVYLAGSFSCRCQNFQLQ